ncbi:MAG: GNAT family N-acetyltransferase [Candidatus Nanoarchaeia archaeon]|nr:GNAT family N-acetyltransferase [Candidatus Nanoarchaeia archaeon]MDD5238886.1 GNAT family N-acetyltransferase [Candidatus Nanoarchaeia archaeon]
MVIRKAAKREIKEIAKLMLKEFSKPPFNENASLKAVIKSLNFYFKVGKVYVAVIDKRIIGIVVFKVEQYWEGPVVIIEDLAIKEEFKKQGIGKKLMDNVEAYAKKNKIRAVYFKTNRKSPAVKFYKKQGYKLKKEVVSMEKKIKLKE